jgi:acetyl/propionyl-CoA carboxylase alpha subunit
MGINTVLVVSDADKGSLASTESSEVVEIGGSTAAESYLNKKKIIQAALGTGCQAVHPGYGFLSEDADFAQQVIDAGLLFVGPSPESIRALGVKTNARKTVAAAGVPITPGSDGASSDDEIGLAAERIGFPIIIKAAAGGGGRGMRIVRASHEMQEALERARAEALKNFGSPEVYCEKFIEGPRHVEVQLFGDAHGNVVHFGTRDCSAQRRHQKLLEEGPAPFLDHDVREMIHEAAVRAAKSVGYCNAGTAEFLVSGRQFYFLEINTRIQVEHPVTEMITGVDLVQLQIRIAMGEPLPMSQPEITFSGHAIELRINAEDVRENFRPALGLIDSWQRGTSVQVREECGYREGDSIPPFYDSLLSKVIVHGRDRAEALYKTHQFLKEYSVEGVPTTIPFHAWLLAHEQFQTDGIDIGFVERTFTAEGLEGALALLAQDPDHRTAHEGEVFIERVDAGGGSIEVIHERGGTFLAVPLLSNGSKSAMHQWCRSNRKKSAIEGAQARLQPDR